MSAENEYQPINCDDYDNLELACQHHMVLEVTLQYIHVHKYTRFLS